MCIKIGIVNIIITWDMSALICIVTKGIQMSDSSSLKTLCICTDN